MNNSNAIYTHTLKQYQIDKLFKFRKSNFLKLYRCEVPRFTQYKYEYEICKWLCLNGFNDKSIFAVMTMWYVYHSIKPNWTRLKNEIIPRSREKMRPIMQERRHKHYLKGKAKQEVARSV